MANFINILGSNAFMDASGAVLAAGTLDVQATDGAGNPIPFGIGRAAQGLTTPVSRTITNGSLDSALQLANPAVTSPVDIGYTFTTTDLGSGSVTVIPGVLIQADSNGNWNIAALNTGEFVKAVPSTVIQGETGPGFTYRGAYDSTVTYAAGDVVTSAGTVYVSLQAANVGSNPASTPANWSVFVPGSGVDGSAIAPASVTVGTGTEQATPANTFAAIDADIDGSGSVLMALLNDGSYWFQVGVRFGVGAPGNLFTGPTSSAAPVSLARDSDGFSYYDAPDSNGNSQIYRLSDTGAILQLTSGNYNNVSPSLSQDGNLLLFSTNRNGTYANYQMDKAGLVQTTLGTNDALLVAVSHVFTTGQSLAEGAYGFTSGPPYIRSTIQPYDNLMLNGGPRCGSDNSQPIANGMMTSLAALTEVASVSGNGQNDSGDGETITSGMLNRMAMVALQGGIHFRGLGTVAAAGGQSYAAVKKGTQTYTNCLAQITAAHNLCVAQGLSHAVRWMNSVHGEADDVALTANYATDMLEWLQNYTADVKAITGQAFGFPHCMSQQSSWTANANEAVGVTSVAMLQAMKANFGLLLIACPKYFFSSTYYANQVHLNADGYRWLGEYYARVAGEWVLHGRFRRPLHIRSANLIGNKIYVSYWMPSPSDALVIDTSLVTPPTANSAGLNGFEYYDNSGSAPAIAAVTLNGPSGVVITLASVPAATSGNRHIAYARTGTAGAAAGSTTGPRGCLRTNSSDASAYGYPNLFDWALHDDFVF